MYCHEYPSLSIKISLLIFKYWCEEEVWEIVFVIVLSEEAKKFKNRQKYPTNQQES